MREYIKKIIHQIIDKWIVGVIAALLIGATLFLVDYTMNFVHLPKDMELVKSEIKANSYQDSIFRSKTRKQIWRLKEQRYNDSITIARYQDLFVKHKWIKP